MAECKVLDCTHKSVAKGLCSTHYSRVRRNGNLKLKQAPNGAHLRYLIDVALTHKLKTKCLIWPFATVNSYGYAQMKYKGKTRRVHRLVCQKIHGKPPTKEHEACHTCGNGHKGCINLHHLYWGTHQDNMDDKIAHGTDNKGEFNPASKLTERDVRKILKLRSNNLTLKEIAHKFNISRRTVGDICAGNTWKHLYERTAKRGFRCT